MGTSPGVVADECIAAVAIEVVESGFKEAPFFWPLAPTSFWEGGMAEETITALFSFTLE